MTTERNDSYDRKLVSSLAGQIIGGVARGDRNCWVIVDDGGNVIAIIPDDCLFDENGMLFEDDIDASVQPFTQAPLEA